jgi:hypothetical protein
MSRDWLAGLCRYLAVTRSAMLCGDRCSCFSAAWNEGTVPQKVFAVGGIADECDRVCLLPFSEWLSPFVRFEPSLRRSH